ncbi:MAG: hypothetical protein IJ054_00810 [Lachnospiraceae bacterium]|nr:hypothetical protein [Lachnospiraceae bacterium]
MLGKDGDNIMTKYTLRNEIEISDVEDPLDRRMCSMSVNILSEGFSEKELDFMTENINSAYYRFVHRMMSGNPYQNFFNGRWRERYDK